MDDPSPPSGGNERSEQAQQAVTDGAVLRGLPSEQARPGDPRVVGFQDEPSPAHIESSAAAIRAVASSLTQAVKHQAKPLSVCFCHVRLAPRLPFNLYGFHVVEVDEAGEVRETVAGDDEVRYALVINQPVALQTEVALRFLFDLVGRQGPLSEVAAHRAKLGDLPGLVASADMAAAETAWDAIRMSSTHAGEALKARALDAGYALEVRYEMDPLPNRELVMRRVPALRRLYNEQEEVRDAVDRTVTRLQGRGGEIRGGTEEIRSLLQQHTTLLGVRQFINQAFRDADVCGNGYVEFDFVGLDPLLRCLRPDEVEILDRQHFALVEDEKHAAIKQHVLHLQGLEQIENPYGISPWEPLLHVVQQQAILRNVRSFVQQRASGRLNDAQRQQISDLARVVDQAEAQMKQRLETLLWFPRRGLPEPLGDLYFSGQERM